MLVKIAPYSMAFSSFVKSQLAAPLVLLIITMGCVVANDDDDVIAGAAKLNNGDADVAINWAGAFLSQLSQSRRLASLSYWLA